MERQGGQMKNDILSGQEASSYLGITKQYLNKLVYDHAIIPVKKSQSELFFNKADLEEFNFKHYKNESFDINNTFVRDVILYYTLQQCFNGNDKRTCQFIDLLKKEYDFDKHAGLINNIPVLSHVLNISEKAFYETYLMVKYSFMSLPADVILVKKGDLNYPRLLTLTSAAPPYLFCRGDLAMLNERLVCVVGSRKASKEAMMKTRQLVQKLVSRNVVVVAGLAKGIDTMAHMTALENQGKTIAVIGTPINQYYPKENKNLQNEIVKRGLVVSQFPPCNKVQRWNFPMRNGVMSGLSIASIIMEAGEKSGTLKHVDYALKQGRNVYIPTSLLHDPQLKWPYNYVKKGARTFASWFDLAQLLDHNNVFLDV